MPNSKRPLVLASSSPYRRELLDRLGLDYTTVSPDIDESALPGERPDALVERLAEQKARKVAETQEGLIIGSDQVATLDDGILGKPGNHENAVKQLARLSGNSVTFHTGLCLLDTGNHELQVDVVPFMVQFRRLTPEQITATCVRNNRTTVPAASNRRDWVSRCLRKWRARTPQR